MGKSLLIIGAGGHGQVVVETAQMLGYEKIDFIDDNKTNAIGRINEIDTLVPSYDGVIVSIGNNEKRQELIERLESIKAFIVTLIHPNAYVSQSATIGGGSIILPGAIVHTNVTIGKGCIISICARIDHDAVVYNYSHINTSAVICAGTKVSGKVEAGQVISN